MTYIHVLTTSCFVHSIVAVEMAVALFAVAVTLFFASTLVDWALLLYEKIVIQDQTYIHYYPDSSQSGGIKIEIVFQIEYLLDTMTFPYAQ